MPGEIVERILVATPAVTAGQRVIASPFQFYLDGNDNIRVEGWNTETGATLQIHGRFLNDKGEVDVLNMELALTANRVRTVRDFAVARGFLLNLVVTVIGASPCIGQTFARVSVIRGLTGATIVMGVMLQGYVTSSQGLGWPGSPIQSSIEGGGYPRIIAGTTPAAGANVFETVPTGARWNLEAFRCGITADITVATRSPYLALQRAGALYFAHAHPQVATSAGVVEWFWAGGVNTEVVINASYVCAALPVRATLEDGDNILVTANNLQAGDQLRDVQYVVQEWLEVE